MGVSGHVSRSGVFELELGIKLRTLVEHPKLCNGMRSGKKFKGIAGGISMGILGPDQFDAEMDFDIGRKYNVLGLGTACPTVFDEDTDMVAVARNIACFFKHESCGQCTPCREGSGWLYQLMCRIEEGNARPKTSTSPLEIATSMGSMPGTTICGLADGNNWAVRTIMNKYWSEFEKAREAHLRPGPRRRRRRRPRLIPTSLIPTSPDRKGAGFCARSFFAPSGRTNVATGGGRLGRPRPVVVVNESPPPRRGGRTTHLTAPAPNTPPMPNPPRPPSARWLRVRIILNRHDPMDLIAYGFPEHEYDPEMPGVLQALDQATDTADLADRIAQVFAEMFGGPSGPAIIPFTGWYDLAAELQAPPTSPHPGAR